MSTRSEVSEHPCSSTSSKSGQSAVDSDDPVAPQNSLKASARRAFRHSLGIREKYIRSLSVRGKLVSHTFLVDLLSG